MEKKQEMIMVTNIINNAINFLEPLCDVPKAESQMQDSTNTSTIMKALCFSLIDETDSDILIYSLRVAFEILNFVKKNHAESIWVAQAYVELRCAFRAMDWCEDRIEDSRKSWFYLAQSATCAADEETDPVELQNIIYIIFTILKILKEKDCFEEFIAKDDYLAHKLRYENATN